MRTIALTEFGAAPRPLDLPIPEPAENEVRVRVHAASVNGFDVAVANGYLKGAMQHRFPIVLGKDFAGTVDAVGVGVTRFVKGDRVFGVVTKPYLGDGSFGEYVVVSQAVGLAKLPDLIDFTEGAALGLAGTAAMDAVRAADLRVGRIALVSGATGGVGSQVVQLAAKLGAEVIATAHTDEGKLHIKSLGATGLVDHTFDVATQVFAGHPKGIDVVFHLAGNPNALLPVVRKGGRFVSTLLGAPSHLPANGVTVAPVFANPIEPTLDRLAHNQANGWTRVAIQRTYDLDEAPGALRDFAQGTLGKLVIRIA